MTFPVVRPWFGSSKAWGPSHYPLVTNVLGHPWARCSTHKLPLSGIRYHILLPGTKPQQKSRAGVPEVVCKIMPLRKLLRRCWCPSSVDIRRSLRSNFRVERNGLAAWTTARLPYTLPRIRCSTGEDTPALLHPLMPTRFYRFNIHLHIYLCLFYNPPFS